MSYKKLKIWKLSRKIVIGIHKMSLTKLPKFEMYENGITDKKVIQINSIEYRRGIWKKDVQKFVHQIYHLRLASTDETIDHLETLFETDSLKDQDLYEDLHQHIKYFREND